MARQILLASGNVAWRRCCPYRAAMLAARRVLGGGALAGTGVLLWLTVGQGLRDWEVQMPTWGPVIILTSLVFVPPVRRLVASLIDAVRSPSPRARRLTTAIVAVVAAAYLLGTAIAQGREPMPVWHDEFCFLLQMRMFSQGILWMPKHALAPFFDSFFVITDPVYCALAFPGPALLYAPELWLDLPTWTLPILAAGLTVGLIYRVTAELLDGTAGLLAAIMLLSLSIFRTMSTMLMGQVPIMLFGLAAVWAYLHWRREQKPIWAIVIGICAGWTAVTRPVDALCWFIPIMAAVAVSLITAPRRTWAGALLMVIAAAPFLTLQLVINRGVTGHLLETPWEFYQDRDYPGLKWGLGGQHAGTVLSPIPQKQFVYRTFVGPQVDAHRPANWPAQWAGFKGQAVCQGILPNSVFLIVLPLGFLFLTRQRLILAAILPLFIGLYVFFPLMLWHYPVIAAPSAIFLALAGIRSIHARRSVEVAITLGICGVCLLSLPELNAKVHDEFFPPDDLLAVNAQLARIPDPRAVVLFRPLSHPQRMEAVYNTDTPWPDDAAIVRAHDLGPRNIEILRYYAVRQPDRVFYLYEPSNHSLTRLGSAGELAPHAAP